MEYVTCVRYVEVPPLPRPQFLAIISDLCGLLKAKKQADITVLLYFMCTQGSNVV